MMPKSTTFSKIQSGERRRFAFAWQCVEEAGIVFNEKEQADYETLATKFAVNTTTHGLCQSLAFSYTKAMKERAHDLLLIQIGQYLALNGLFVQNVISELNACSEVNGSSTREVRANLIESLMGLREDQIRYATEESLKMLEWLRRFASGKFGTTQEDNRP